MGSIGYYLVATVKERACAFADVILALAVRVGFRVKVVAGVFLFESGQIVVIGFVTSGTADVIAVG